MLISIPESMEVVGGVHTRTMLLSIGMFFVAAGLLFFPAAPFILFIKGKDITVPKGSEITRGIGMTIEPDGGSLEPGQPANLVLKGATERKMHNGEWVTR